MLALEFHFQIALQTAFAAALSINNGNSFHYWFYWRNFLLFFSNIEFLPFVFIMLPTQWIFVAKSLFRETCYMPSFNPNKTFSLVGHLVISAVGATHNQSRSFFHCLERHGPIHDRSCLPSLNSPISTGPTWFTDNIPFGQLIFPCYHFEDNQHLCTASTYYLIQHPRCIWLSIFFTKYITAHTCHECISKVEVIS